MKNFKSGSITLPITFFLVISTLSFTLRAQTNSDGSSPQFLYKDFSAGKVKLKNGGIQSMILNFNTISEKIAFQKDDKIYDIVNSDGVDTVFIQNTKFVPVSKIYYEVILGAPITFFLQYKGTLIPPGTPAAYGGTSQVSNSKLISSVSLAQGNYNLKLPTDYTVTVGLIYWIRKDNNMTSFENQKQFFKIFSGKESELKQFIKQNHIKFDNLSDMLKLAEYTNSIVR